MSLGVKQSRRKPITIAFLGIDGSGKSMHSEKIASWLQENGIKCKIIPFHQWLFADKLKKKIGKYVDKGREESSLEPYAPQKYSLPALIKPPMALIDNILMYYLSKWKYRNYDVLIFDRFICATFIKFKALNYPVGWAFPLMKLIKPKIGIVLDIPVEKSKEKIEDRKNHLLYTKEQLSVERKEYLDIAREQKYPVFNTLEPFEVIHAEIREYLKRTLKKHA